MAKWKRITGKRSNREKKKKETIEEVQFIESKMADKKENKRKHYELKTLLK